MTKPKKPDIKELEQKVGELTEALQRERADAINIRRRHDEQVASLKNLVKAQVVKDLLPVIDNFERAFNHYPLEGKEWDLGDELHEWIKGVRKVREQFAKTLEEIGVKRIKTVGEKFDPHLHEAVSVEGEGTEEIISEELQAGYTLGEEVIRHAMVKVKNKLS